MESFTEPSLGPKGSVQGETPALRMIALLELITTRDQLFTLQSLVDQTGIPKPTLHRMLQQLEGASLLTRHSDGRHYATGSRMRRLAEDVLLNDTRNGARNAILQDLVAQVGESCNITALSGNEVIYLDRVETPEPIRVHLGPGSRVPAHCSASGKLIIAQYGQAQRERLLGTGRLRQYTTHTLTDFAALESEMSLIRQQGYALDNQEYLEGLVCLAVLVPNPAGRSNMCVAIQAPLLRKTAADLQELLPLVQQAAVDIARIEDLDENDEPLAAGW